jgi:CBS domain-containing protein
MKVSTILSKKKAGVITIRPDQLVREAVQLLASHRIGALVVVDSDRRVVGILSERDIIWSAAENETIFDQSVKAIMTHNVIVGMPQDEVMSVAHTMTERRFRHLPIVDGDELMGMISIGDILKTQRDAYRGEIDTLETQILAQGE